MLNCADECLVDVDGEVTMAVLGHFDVCEDVHALYFVTLGRQLTDDLRCQGDYQALPVDTRSRLLIWGCHNLLWELLTLCRLPGQPCCVVLT